VLLFCLPLIIYYFFFNLFSSDPEARIFLVQNGLLIAILIAALMLLWTDRYRPAVHLLFFIATPLVQLSFLIHPQSWFSFTILHASLSILLATAFFVHLWELIVLSILSGGIFIIQVWNQIRGGYHTLSDSLGFIGYFLLALFFSQVMFHLFDYSERLLRQKEAAVRDKEQLVREKERLLLEVHHRIKNHMDTIYSLLSLQAKDFDDPRMQGAFEEALGRIRMMQTIYQNLYTSENPEHLSSTGFLKELIADLERILVMDGRVRIEHQIEAIDIPSKETLPVAIIINELLTNAVKYAFPLHRGEELGLAGELSGVLEAGRKGLVEVSVQQPSCNEIFLEITDNGIGIGDLPPERFGFGLTLVEGYVKQYNGEMVIGPRIEQPGQLGQPENESRDWPGTRIRIRLTIPKES
jgi:two-component sensor histidine kinase